MSDLRERIRNDPDVDLNAIQAEVLDLAERGAYHESAERSARDELEGAITNRIAAQFRGWDKYDHLDSATRADLEREIRSMAADIADDIESQVGSL